jgi:hypothetical protein
LLGAGLGIGRNRSGVVNLVLNGGVKLVERGSGLGRLMQNVAAAEARQIIGGIAKPKLMNGAVSAEDLELSMLEIGVHLQDRNSVVRILKRAHSEVTPSFHLEN